MTVSEVTRIRENIANEYKAAMWGLTGLAYGASRHDFISARLENMGRSQIELAFLVGEQQAGAFVADTLANLPRNQKDLPFLIFSRIYEARQKKQPI